MPNHERNLKEDNKVRRTFFAANLRDLTSKVMRLNRLDAAKALGVDYGWFRKACSVGLSRADNRSLSPLKKVAERFHMSVEDLWTPALLVQIWAGGYLPDVRAYFIREFSFDQFVRNSKEFQEAVEDLQDAGSLGPQPGLPEEKFGARTQEHNAPETVDAESIRKTCEQLTTLLATGRYEYLRALIGDLFATERSGPNAT